MEVTAGFNPSPRSREETPGFKTSPGIKDATFASLANWDGGLPTEVDVWRKR